MTPAFLLHIVNSFHEHLNVRAVRRSLVSMYTANCLSFVARRGDGENGLGWAMAAIPKRKVLSFVLGRALDEFLDKKVFEMQEQLFVYCGQGLRNDGNFKLAKRIGVRRQGSRSAARPSTVVLGFCGVDGTLLAPVHPMRTEDFTDNPRLFRRVL